MDTSSGYEDRDSSESSFDRRLKLENAATGIAIANGRLSGRDRNNGKRSSGSQQQNSDNSNTNSQGRQ